MRALRLFAITLATSVFLPSTLWASDCAEIAKAASWILYANDNQVDASQAIKSMEEIPWDTALDLTEQEKLSFVQDILDSGVSVPQSREGLREAYLLGQYYFVKCKASQKGVELASFAIAKRAVLSCISSNLPSKEAYHSCLHSGGNAIGSNK